MNKDEWTHHCKVCLRENADCTCNGEPESEPLKPLEKAMQALRVIANNNNNEEPRAYAKRMLEELEYEKKEDI